MREERAGLQSIHVTEGLRGKVDSRAQASLHHMTHADTKTWALLTRSQHKLTFVCVVPLKTKALPHQVVDKRRLHLTIAPSNVVPSLAQLPCMRACMFFCTKSSASIKTLQHREKHRNSKAAVRQTEQFAPLHTCWACWLPSRSQARRKGTVGLP